MARGRPRKIDPDAALDTAVRLFWERGYEGTSMNDVAAATGMAKPGLYATFGDKEALYGKALTRYVEGLGGPILETLVNSTDLLAVSLRRFLEAVVQNAADKTMPGGCFLLNSVVECAHQPASLEALGRTYHKMRTDAMLARMRRAREEGDLPADADIEALAAFFSGQALALAVMGRAGASKKTFKRFIDVALSVLP